MANFDANEDINSEDAYSEFSLPEDCILFAMRSFGYPICFNFENQGGKFYLWNVENGELSHILGFVFLSG